jgi:two-component system cell cycle response regulator CtrA
MRVLLVEDDQSTAKSIELMLKSDGYVVDMTDMGEDGLEIGKLYEYDIIILDLMLPDLDGYEVLKRLRAAKRELMARIQAIVRRSKGHAQSVIKTGPIAVNLDARTVEVDDKQLHLTSKEYGIIELLSLRKGSTLTKEMFLNHLYGGMDEPEVKIIDVFICKLRKKIEKLNADGGGCIETVWGRGYVLRDPNGTVAKVKETVSG